MWISVYRWVSHFPVTILRLLLFFFAVGFNTGFPQRGDPALPR